MKDTKERLKEAESALAGMFDIACDNLCVYNEVNLGKDKCPYRDSFDSCPLGSVMDEYLKGNKTEMPAELADIVTQFVDSIRRNIKIADHIRTEMGYEIALELLKDVLDRKGYFTDEVFKEKGDDDDF